MFDIFSGVWDLLVFVCSRLLRFNKIIDGFGVDSLCLLYMYNVVWNCLVYFGDGPEAAHDNIFFQFRISCIGAW